MLIENLRGFLELGLEYRENGRWVFWPNGFLLKVEPVLFLFFFLGSHGDNEECVVMERVAIGKVEEWCCHGELKKKRTELKTETETERGLES